MKYSVVVIRSRLAIFIQLYDKFETHAVVVTFSFSASYYFSVIMISLRLRTVSAIALCVLGVCVILNTVMFLETVNSVKKGKVKLFSDMHDCQ